MVAMARGYLRFALRNVALFQLMFRLQEANHNDERVREAGAVAFALAAEAVAAFHSIDDLSADPEVAPRVVGLWGMAHGLADLAIANQFGPPGRGAGQSRGGAGAGGRDGKGLPLDVHRRCHRESRKGAALASHAPFWSLP